MKALGLLAGLLVLGVVTHAAAVDAPASLGEAAKKEAERREKARKAGPPTRALTEEDLASAKGTLANTAGGKGSPAAAGAQDHPQIGMTEGPDAALPEAGRG